MSNHGGVLHVIRCKDTRTIVAKALEGGWEWIGYTKTGHVEIRWPATGALLHCATTPSDRNSWKVLAREIQRVSGVVVRAAVKHHRSRKPLYVPDPQVEASRRRYAREQEAQRAAADEAERRRRNRILGIEALVDYDRRRRDIEDLMRPGYGR